MLGLADGLLLAAEAGIQQSDFGKVPLISAMVGGWVLPIFPGT